MIEHLAFFAYYAFMIIFGVHGGGILQRRYVARNYKTDNIFRHSYVYAIIIAFMMLFLALYLNTFIQEWLENLLVTYGYRSYVNLFAFVPILLSAPLFIVSLVLAYKDKDTFVSKPGDKPIHWRRQHDFALQASTLSLIMLLFGFVFLFWPYINSLLNPK